MSDVFSLLPEPTEQDAKEADRLMRLATEASLKAHPYEDQACASCVYYVDPDAEYQYCWQPGLGLLVGASWWCHWYERRDEE